MSPQSFLFQVIHAQNIDMYSYMQATYQLLIMLTLLIAGASFLTDCTDGGRAGKSTKCVPLKPNGQVCVCVCVYVYILVYMWYT
jgi:hypothetical protein